MIGYLIPCPQRVSPKAAVVAKAADYTVVVADMGKIITNTGAGGAVSLTLPLASAAAGGAIRAQLTVAQVVKLVPGAATEKIYFGGDGVVNKYAQVAGVIGNFIEVASDGTDWLVTQSSGVVTKEA